ncbi:MAG: hypothetical protein MUE35_13685 [Hydrogenophaga sp.]|jgi:hypothetical protein|nr:hypothetical protein [Hydrogenophaga sp.]
MNYTTHRQGRGIWFEVRDTPPLGSEILLTDGRKVRYDGEGPAGMLLVTDASGVELLLFPQQVVGAGEEKAG